MPELLEAFLLRGDDTCSAWRRCSTTAGSRCSRLRCTTRRGTGRRQRRPSRRGPYGDPFHRDSFPRVGRGTAATCREGGPSGRPLPRLPRRRERTMRPYQEAAPHPAPIESAVGLAQYEEKSPARSENLAEEPIQPAKSARRRGVGHCEIRAAGALNLLHASHVPRAPRLHGRGGAARRGPVRRRPGATGAPSFRRRRRCCDCDRRNQPRSPRRRRRYVYGQKDGIMRGWLTAQARPLFCRAPASSRKTARTAPSMSSARTTRTACRSRSASASRPGPHHGRPATRHSGGRCESRLPARGRCRAAGRPGTAAPRRAGLRDGPGPQHRQAHVGVRRRQAPHRPAQQAVGQFRREVVGQARVTIACQHHLPALGQQGVEGVQELLLRRLLAARKCRSSTSRASHSRKCLRNAPSLPSRIACTKRLVKSSVVM